MEKPVTIIFCGEQQAEARKLAGELRTGVNSVSVARASPYMADKLLAGTVIIMPDVRGASRAAVLAIYPHAQDRKVECPAPKVIERPVLTLPTRRKRELA